MSKENPPVGETFEVNGETYHLKPRLFSTSVMNKFSAMVKDRRRSQRQERLNEIAGLKDVLDSDALLALVKEYLPKPGEEDILEYTSVAELIMDASSEYLEVAIAACCDEISNQKDAKKVINDHGNALQLAMLVMSTAKEDLGTSGNFGHLLQLTEEELRALLQENSTTD